MKKIAIFFIFMVTTIFSLFSLPPIETGIGGFFMPGQYDYTLITLYTNSQNNNGIENLTPDEIQPVNYIGLTIHSAVELYGFMIKPQFTIAIPTKTTIDYVNTSTGTTIPYTIEHKSLLITFCPWVGPIIEGKNLGTLYILSGPYLMYAEWRDREIVDDSESSSSDRQYNGFGVTFPLLLGGRKFITKNLGFSLEGIILAQQILIESHGKDNFAASQTTLRILPFPRGIFYNPLTLILQFSAIYKFK